MGLLTPLYIAGLAALSLPLVFHLIRRTPRGRESFGSLMFLAPSPPRITRRSRLDNVVLFLLRAAALTLVAVAFARPFFRDTSALDVETATGRRILLVIDDSASMRRHGIWPAALDEAENVLHQLRPNDRLAVFACAGSMRCVWAFDEQRQLPATSTAAAALRRLRTIRPGWSTSDIGGALVQASDMLDAFTDERPTTDDADRQIVLISDLQEGASLDALQSYQWPGRVRLHVHRV
ncbi:MAG: VWA domain-containing protein, partial [Planctomycetes bacterium]|nr:VWA domain-containing protein [Planctomycetota bacterium]